MDAWYLVTLIGQPEMWAASTLIIAIAYFLFRKKLDREKRKIAKRTAFIYILGVLISLLLVFVLKSTINTERPCIPCVNGAENCNPYCGTDSSFPSGHAAAIFSVVTSLYFGIRKRQIIPLYIISVLVASSRYFLGVHTIADVMAGAVMGIVVPFIFSLVYEKRFGPRH